MDYKQKIEEKRLKLVNTLIDFIEKNPTQWEAGWYSVSSDSPINGKTQKKYKGMNALYLCVLSAIKGYKDPRWVTFNQAKELGANVRTGEKSSEVFYWSYYDKETKKPYDAKTCEGMTYEERKKYWEDNVRPVIKFYQVFNAAQCDNMPEYELQSTPEMEAEERLRQNAVIEQIITNSAAPVNYDGGDRAYYSPSKDSIHLPKIADFKTMQDYYATALHEIAHSTGHANRLNRDLTGFFGTPDYAREELRAELASVFMQVEFGISVEGKHFENHGAYLASWLKAVKDNQKEFFSAALDAEKITDYVAENYLNEKAESKEEQTADNAEIITKAENSVGAREKADISGKPYVEIEWSESPKIKNLTVLPFREAEAMLRGENAKERAKEGYYKTKLHIYYTNRNGEPDEYRDLRFDIGTETNGIIEHIKESLVLFDENEQQGIRAMLGILHEALEEKKTQEETTDKEVVPKFEANTSFAKQVDAVLSGADTTSTHLKVMSTPLILRQVGAQNLPVLMTAKHLKSIVAESGDDISVNYHGIDTDLVKRLPELLSDPVLVMDSLTRDDSVVIVTSAVDRENRPIIGAIKFDGFGRQDEQIIEANILLSVYGRNQFNDFIQRNFDANSILYWNKEKSQELSVNPGVQFPDVMANLDSNIIIRKAKAFVNSSEEKNKNTDKNAQNAEENKQAEPAEETRQVEQVEENSDVAATKVEFGESNEEQTIATERQPGTSPVVVNLYAGPGAGKTTAALELTAALKKAGLNVEYVSEYAKELVLEGKAELLNDQRHVTDEQFHRLDRLRSSVDVIVTDSPVLLGIVYGGEKINDEYKAKIREYYDSFNNLDLYIERRTEYQTEGRLQSEQEAKALDTAISNMLKQQGIATQEHTRQNIAQLIELIKETDLAEEVRQAGQAAINAYDISLSPPLSFSNEMLLSRELAKLGYSIDSTVERENNARDNVATEYAYTYWLNTLSYVNADGKMIQGQYGRQFDGILIESTNIGSFTLEGQSPEEVQAITNVINGFGVETRIEQVHTAEQVRQADTVEQVRQAQQVKQGKWNKIPLNVELIGEERGKSTQIRMPNGEYSSFVFFAPMKFVRHDEKSGAVQLSVNDDYNYVLMKGNQRVELSGSELRRTIAGEEIGKKAQRMLSEANAQRLIDINRNVPEEMRQNPNWCVYTTRWNEAKGKTDKQIYSPTLGLSEDGRMQWASIDKPETWATFDAAMKFAEENNCAGLVYALDGKGISCIDLDKSVVKDGKLNGMPTDRAEGELSALAARLSEEMKDTYIETSASGNGIHIFVKDDLLAKGKYKNRAVTGDGEIEVYDDRRFMSMTGKIRSDALRLGKSPVETTAYIQEKLGKQPAVSNEKPQARQSRHIDNSDSAVIERIRKSKKGAEFEALYRGENVTGDNSRNDFKLLNMLAFFTDCDESQMERIFRSSGLYRPEKGEAYLSRSINKANSTLQMRMSDRAFSGGSKKKSGGRGNSK